MSINTKSEGEQYDIKYQGTVIPIKNDKLKFNFQKINDITAKIENESDLTKKINTFSEIFNVIDEIVKIIKKEKVDDTNQESIILYLSL